MLFNEPKLLKSQRAGRSVGDIGRFSALQRAEIAEIERQHRSECGNNGPAGFSALQRAEIAEMETKMKLDVLLITFQCSSTSRNC